MVSNQSQISSRVFYRTVAALVIPLALQNLINVGIQSADVIMLARVGETALSAASLAGQVQFVMMLLFFGLSSGAMVLAAQYWGKGDLRTIEKIFAITLRISACIGFLFFLAATCIPGGLMRIFSPDPAVIEQGIRYLRFIAPGYLFISFTNIYLSLLRSVEKVVVSTLIYFSSLLINVVLNAILIFGLLGFPAMGIAGAALATTIARSIEFVVVIIYASRNKIVRLRKKDFLSKHTVLFKDFVHHASPTIFNELLWGLGMSTNAVIIGHLGVAAVAANSVAGTVRQLAMVVCFGIANAAAIMVGKALGAGDKDLAKQHAARLVRLSLAMGVLGSGVILLIRHLVGGVLRLSPQADEYLRFLLLLMAMYVIAQSFDVTLIVGVFRGGGDTRFGLILDASTMWGCSIILGALAAFVFHLPVEWVFFILMIDEFIKVPLAAIRYKSQSWLRNVTR